MARYVLVKPAYFKGKRYGIGEIVDESIIHSQRATALIRMKVIAKYVEETGARQKKEEQKSVEKLASSTGAGEKRT